VNVTLLEPGSRGPEGLDFMDVFALGVLLVFFLALWMTPLLFFKEALSPALYDLLFWPGTALPFLLAGNFGRRRLELPWARTLFLPRPEPLRMAAFHCLWALLLLAEVALFYLLRRGAAPTDLLRGVATVPVVATAVVLGPFCEEFFFRGVLCRGLALRYGRRLGIVLSAGLFALAHLHWAQLPGTFAFGLLAGWGQQRWGSILPCVAIHIANNALALLATRHPGLALGVLLTSCALALFWGLGSLLRAALGSGTDPRHDG
jgi:membrane protease YdiL (CAAX protease family)